MKDLHGFPTEQEKKKKEEAKKPHAVKEGEGADDKEYLAVMSEYKQLRRNDPVRATKLLKKAEKLKNVSKNACIAAAYL